MKIGKYFTMEELTCTSTGLVNIPHILERAALIELVNNILEPARELLGSPITINSGYRSVKVNQKVGGVASSQHVKGEAADVKCIDNAKLFNIIKDNLNFDQLIWEKGNDQQPDWIHVSFRKGSNRKQVLIFDGKKYYPI